MAKLIDTHGATTTVDATSMLREHVEASERRVILNFRRAGDGALAQVEFDRHSAIQLATDFYNHAEKLFQPQSAAEIQKEMLKEATLGALQANYCVPEAERPECDDAVEMAKRQLKKKINQARARIAFAILRGDAPDPNDERDLGLAKWNLQQLLED